MTSANDKFGRLQADDIARERRIFWSEIVIVAFLGIAGVVYLMVR